MTLEEAQALFGRMLDGGMTDDEIEATLVALADRGETAAEVAGAALAMRARMIQVKAPADAIDVCGTGGDGQHSLNVSTAVALVVAACEVAAGLAIILALFRNKETVNLDELNVMRW